MGEKYDNDLRKKLLSEGCGSTRRALIECRNSGEIERCERIEK